MASPLLEWSFDEESGAVLDLSGNGHDFTPSGSTVRTADGGGHTGKGLTQTANATQVGSALTGLQTTSRTWMTWIKFITSVNGWILEFHNAGADTGVWGLLDISGVLRFRAKNSSNTVFESSGIDRNLGNWQHIAATHDGANLRLYINGTLFSTTPMAFAVWTADVMNVLDQTGANVILDETRMFGEALSQSEIATWMTTAPGSGPVINEGTLDGSFSSPSAALSGTATATGTLDGSFSSPVRSLFATASTSGSMSGSFGQPVVDGTVTATAEVTLEGTFAAPVTAITGAVVPPQPGTLAGQFSAPTAAIDGMVTTEGLLDGSFSQATVSIVGGLPIAVRDIIFSIEPGTRAATSIEVGPSRTEIGAGNMDAQWRNGSRQFIDFVVKLLDPEGELTLPEVEVIPFKIAVTRTGDTPALDDAAWVDPSVPPVASSVGTGFAVAILHMYQATEKGFHRVWVRFGPTPEEPVYLATSFVVL